MLHSKTSVLFDVMVVVVTVPRDVLIVEDSMFVSSLEALAVTEVITCVVPAVDVLIPSVVPHLDAGVGGGDDVEMFNGSISSKSPSFVSKLLLKPSFQLWFQVCCSTLTTQVGGHNIYTYRTIKTAVPFSFFSFFSVS